MTHAQEIRTEHRALDGLLEALASASNERLAELLAELHTYLQDHFETEERAGGFFEQIYALGPMHSSAVGFLKDEHAEILREVGRLRALKDTTALRQRLTRLIEHLKDHEVRETTLLLETSLGLG